MDLHAILQLASLAIVAGGSLIAFGKIVQTLRDVKANQAAQAKQNAETFGKINTTIENLANKLQTSFDALLASINNLKTASELQVQGTRFMSDLLTQKHVTLEARCDELNMTCKAHGQKLHGLELSLMQLERTIALIKTEEVKKSERSDRGGGGSDG